MEAPGGKQGTGCRPFSQLQAQLEEEDSLLEMKVEGLVIPHLAISVTALRQCLGLERQMDKTWTCPNLHPEARKEWSTTEKT